MKLRAHNLAFTLIETVMAMLSVGIVGLAIFYTLFSGMVLFSENSAMNISHEEARVALLQLQQDLHSAVSLPCLTDSNANMLSGTAQGPAAGVEFQELVQPSQYCQVAAAASIGAQSLKVGLPSGYPTPTTSMRLIVPSIELESNISSVSVSGTTATVGLSGTVQTTLTLSDSNGNNYNIIAFFTQRVYYYVNGNVGSTGTNLNLNYMGISTTKSYVMAATNISGTAPFSIPSTESGAPNYHDVLAVNLSAQDVNTTALSTRFKFNTSSIMLSGQIPAYATLTVYQ